jgi:hypothetical protein
MKPSQAITAERQLAVVLQIAAFLVIVEQGCLWMLAQFVR